ncbi:MAG: DNA-binding response regulator, partial [Proteobacteria bacterium]|nr:DNA-binding response regulator [Pseudomonadota bacterium]
MAKILYIEDDVSLSQLVKRRLERHGYDVELAFDGL